MQRNLPKASFVGLALLVTSIFVQVESFGQWGAPFSNSWIRYDKQYFRISVSETGLFHVPLALLPKTFDMEHPELLQLWHRGKEVALISADQSGITFYGVKNDGASDSLLYRPFKARMNPHYSLFADESAYFLTIGDKPGKRAKAVSQPVDSKIPFTAIHWQTDVTTFQNKYSLSTESYFRPDFLNSFYEAGASRTGDTLNGKRRELFTFKLKSPADPLPDSITVKMLFHGRTNNQRTIRVFAGKDEKSLRQACAVPSSDFTGVECRFKLGAGDLHASKEGVLAIDTKSSAARDLYSVAYFEVAYWQNIAALPGTTLNLPPTNALWTRLSIPATVYDITDTDSPVALHGMNDFLMVPREPGKSVRLYIPGEMREVAAKDVRAMD